jgi:hypothetical protein
MARARNTKSRSTRSTAASNGGRRATSRRTSRSRRPAVELTSLESKLGEVIGLAMAAQGATDKIAKLTTDRELKQMLKTMKAEASDAEQRGAAVAGTFSGKKSAIMKEAREVKQKATKMMSTYLERDSDGLDGFEFLTMAEAGEVGHWTVLDHLNKQAKHPGVRELTRIQLPIQRRHLKDAMAGSIKLAEREDATAAA